ncbi:MAG: phenylalanine--tRNA ligase subunit beta [Campylobacterota bacterium]|nr:phenylalanine--tRNA ligase subunit beta [Campylobacterota bacterium]
MIVTKSWLNEFVDLESISNERLYETFNAIGLEVDSIKSYRVPQKVVIGKIISCEKHPDADKLNVCRVDVGAGIKQIVCGAANVVDAEYVAVALIGAILPDDFEIKFATLRGVDSEGMICASSELGLPDTGKGIMILDSSIGELEIGLELGGYERVSDSVIELELTANRGDCLSIHGVARDLSVALNRELKPFEYHNKTIEQLDISWVADLQTRGDTEADLCYQLAAIGEVNAPFLITLRVAMVELELGSRLDNLLAYTTHATGVIMRLYDAKAVQDEDGKALLSISSKERGITSVSAKEELLSIVGVNQNSHSMAKDNSELLLIESSYTHPDLLVEAIANKDLDRDTLYYKTSRGSESNLLSGMEYLSSLLEGDSECRYYDGYLDVTSAWEPTAIAVDCEEICSIIGQEIDSEKIVTILDNLGFDILNRDGDRFGVAVPRYRHDIKNIQDVTEEIVRIIGINNIKSKPLDFLELNRLNQTTSRYAFKKALRHRAASAGLYENVSYLFSERCRLKAYGFDLVEEELDLTNPIAEDLNTLRSTILVNLLEAVKRNVNYTEKSIGLFEIGAVFNEKREQREVLSMIFSGQESAESISNSGKPEMIDFASFVAKLGSVVGSFELVTSTQESGLIHPYQSADILYRGAKCGFVSKLHPVVQEEYGIYDTFIAELEMEALMPLHINAEPISKFQGVYKDLSIVIKDSLPYSQISREIDLLAIDILKNWYPVDIYRDEALGEKRSLTIRFFIQSMDKTLEEGDIESVISSIMNRLEQSCQATLR